MANYNSSSPNPPASFGRSLLLLAMTCAAGVIIYKTFFSDGPLANLLQKPQGVDVTYIPSDFKPNLDEESTLAILTNPERYHKEFNELVYNFNLSLLYHVANRMGMADSLKRKLEPEYRKHHDYLKNLYYNDFIALKDTSATLYETWYQDAGNSAVKIFNEVAGKYTCFFVTQIVATLLKTDNGRLMAKGKKIDTPCGIAINEGLKPMVDRLQARAAIVDFSASKGLLKEKIEMGITEMATYEIRSRKALNQQLQYKILGYAVSSTDIEVQAMSVIKAGFKLDKYFDITLNPKKELVIVTLPPPTILSHEVYPRVDKLDVGILAGVNEQNMNESLNSLRKEFRYDAIENDKILEKAKDKADEVMNLMLGPIVKSMNKKYKIAIRYKDDMVDDSGAMETMRRGEPGASAEGAIIKDKPTVDKLKGKKRDAFIPQ